MRGWHGVGFAVFCLLAGSRWLVDNAYPTGLPVLLQQALHFAVIGALALPVCWSRRRVIGGKWWKIGLAGLLLLGVPSALNVVAGTVVEQAGAALFTLVPLFVVVGVAALGTGARGLMVPAMVGMAGGLLGLPFALPSTASGGLLLGLVLVGVLCAAAASVWLHEMSAKVDLAALVGVVCVVNAVALGGAGMSFERAAFDRSAVAGEMARCLVFDLPAVVLLLWLTREMEPARLASRYVMVPLVTVVEGISLVRPAWDGRLLTAVVLMMVGGGGLLYWRDAEDRVSGLGLRGKS